MQIRPKPRKWQVAAREKWAEKFSGIAKVVTGGGKTVFALLCIETFLQRFDKGRVVIVVPSLALADQWVVTLAEDGGIDPEKISVFSGDEKHSHLNDLNVCIINNLYGHVLPQVEVFATGSYDEDIAHVVALKEPALDFNRLKWLMKGEPPQVMVISSGYKQEWADALRRESIEYKVCRLFSSNDGGPLLMVADIPGSGGRPRSAHQPARRPGGAGQCRNDAAGGQGQPAGGQ